MQQYIKYMSESLPTKEKAFKKLPFILLGLVIVIGTLSYIVFVSQTNIRSLISGRVAVDSEDTLQQMNEMENANSATPFVSSRDELDDKQEDEESTQPFLGGRPYEELFPPFIDPLRPDTHDVIVYDVNFNMSTVTLEFMPESYTMKYHFNELQVFRTPYGDNEYHGSQFRVDDIGKNAFFTVDIKQNILAVSIMEESPNELSR